MRINRFLAQAGFGSRRTCEALVLSGEVTVNGQTVTNLSTSIGLKDQVKVGRKLVQREVSMTAVLHKPAGYICTMDDPEKRKTIFDLLPRDWPRLFYVGRLDSDSEGLLLVTNDGALSHRLTHPKYKLPKTYEVMLDQEFDFEEAPKLLKGMVIESEWARMEEIHRLGPKCVKVILTQGIKRQIRLMFWRLGYTVTRLIRTQIGGLKLGRLRPGEWKILEPEEVALYFARTQAKTTRRGSVKHRAKPGTGAETKHEGQDNVKVRVRPLYDRPVKRSRSGGPGSQTAGGQPDAHHPARGRKVVGQRKPPQRPLRPQPGFKSGSKRGGQPPGRGPGRRGGRDQSFEG